MQKALLIILLLFTVAFTSERRPHLRMRMNNNIQGIRSHGLKNRNAQSIAHTNLNSTVNNIARIKGNFNTLTQVGVSTIISNNIAFARNAPLVVIGSQNSPKN